ncbi:uncharacterized protein LOC133886340 [Phragmites australis]|uniref:uncharacterized protein LOC133886340 n=1 Tax=Phragmites australis TaxID=29695 RepID=UPI002D77645A|nr:uncharacterized protein LOC133886340 [Phragmites australis]
MPGYTLPLGQVELPVTFGSHDNFRTENVVFGVAEVPLPYNVILRHPALARFMVATNYTYITVNMPGPTDPIFVPAETGNTVSCAEQLYSALASASAKVEGHSGGPGPSSFKSRLVIDASVPTKKVALGTDPSKVTRIGVDLDTKLESMLVAFLGANTDVFAWQPSDIPQTNGP